MLVIQIILALLYALNSESNFCMSPNSTYRYEIIFRTTGNPYDFVIENRKLELIKTEASKQGG